MPTQLEPLLEAIEREAERADFPIDRPVYEKAGRDPLRPIPCAGALDAPVCIFGRDLGKDEVAAAEPLIGAGGRLVRAGVYLAWEGAPPAKSDKRIEKALDHVLLANTVAYKPPGNKAYSPAVKERFRPFVAELLARYWTGNVVITLGTEAFEWFAPYADPAAFAEFWKREDRYEADLDCLLTVDTTQKSLTLMPLPHPSPLNARWHARFPELLAQRLAAVRRRVG